ncbi:YaaA family protein [Paraoerskovia sediminicola]|uniref:YaaA family protein n=1 Tax=Paraoerskovia sediminicola TaxID=1138587 RepID=UPI002572C83D|nr:peroxide stress protein YaaA [Paraoerskovia sediminicola]
MLVLLPPSEGKTVPDGGAPVDPASLGLPSLTAQRERVLDALVAASARADAIDVLGVTPGLAAEVARNVDLRSAPAGPASSVYTGVLYEAAGFGRLTAAQTRRAATSVLTVSALWGAVSPVDRIPAYRLSMGTTLPGVGALATAWRPHLTAALDERASGDVVVDCRSASYAAAWRPAARTEWLAVKVLREVDGKRSVVSHNAKHTRGVLTGHLLRRRTAPTTARGVVAAAQELVGTTLATAVGTGLPSNLLEVSLHPRPARGPRTLELVVS